MAVPERPRFALHLLPREAFPFTILAYKAGEAAELYRMLGPTSTVPGGLEPVWEKTIEAPEGNALDGVYVPPLYREHGPVMICVRWDNPAAMFEPQQMFWPDCECAHPHSLHQLWGRCTTPECRCRQYTPTVPKEEH